MGNGGTIELDFAINRDGLVEPSHAARYQAFGGWIHACYGGPPTFAGRALANASASVASAAQTVSLVTESRLVDIDRVMLQEDQAFGQRIRAWRVEVRAGASGGWAPFAQGRAVGNKRIAVAEAPAPPVAQFRLTVTEAAEWPVHLSNFAAFASCPAAK